MIQMTKEEAIKICKQVRKYFKGGKLAIDDTDAIYKALTNAIEALKATQWISVSERLPSAEHNLEGFLTTVRCYDTTDVFISVYENGKFGHWDGEKLIPNENVIAWMECPEPYVPQESEGKK